MTPAFVTGPALPASRSRSHHTCPRMVGAQQVVDEKYPIYLRNRAPFIRFDGESGISLEMKPVQQFASVDKTTEPIFDYSDPDEFKPNKPVPPSDISWPSGDGRGKKMTGTKGFFTQPNLREYGPFPDFFKVRVPLFFCKHVYGKAFGRI